jgi:hypothetical protein
VFKSLPVEQCVALLSPYQGFEELSSQSILQATGSGEDCCPTQAQAACHSNVDADEEEFLNKFNPSRNATVSDFVMRIKDEMTEFLMQ